MARWFGAFGSLERIIMEFVCDKGAILARDVTDDSERAGFIGDPLNGRWVAGDECDLGAPGGKHPHQRKSKTRGPAGDGDAKIPEIGTS